MNKNIKKTLLQANHVICNNCGNQVDWYLGLTNDINCKHCMNCGQQYNQPTYAFSKISDNNLQLPIKKRFEYKQSKNLYK